MGTGVKDIANRVEFCSASCWIMFKIQKHRIQQVPKLFTYQLCVGISDLYNISCIQYMLARICFEIQNVNIYFTRDFEYKFYPLLGMW